MCTHNINFRIVLRSSRGPFRQALILRVALGVAWHKWSTGLSEYGPWLALSASPAVLVSCVYCYKLPKWSSLKQQKCVLWQFWRPGVWAEYHGAKIKVPSGLIPSGSSREESFLPLPVFGGCQYSLACGNITSISVPHCQPAIFGLWLFLHLPLVKTLELNVQLVR